MFGLSFGEIVIIAIFALLVLGPDKLPDAAKQAAKLMRQFKSATDDLKGQIETEMHKAEQDVLRPTLVPNVPARPIGGPAGAPPAASAENVPGLEAALVEAPAEEPASPAVAGTSAP